MWPFPFWQFQPKFPKRPKVKVLTCTCSHGEIDKISFSILKKGISTSRAHCFGVKSQTKDRKGREREGREGGLILYSSKLLLKRQPLKKAVSGTSSLVLQLILVISEREGDVWIGPIGARRSTARIPPSWRLSHRCNRPTTLGTLFHWCNPHTLQYPLFCKPLSRAILKKSREKAQQAKF